MWPFDAIGRRITGATQFPQALSTASGPAGSSGPHSRAVLRLDVAVSSLAVETVAFEDPRVQRLVTQVQAYYVKIYGNPDESPVDPAEFAPPGGRFLLGTVDGGPVAMGGWRMRPDLTEVLGARVAEVKRMFVLPTARRRGHASGLLAALEQSAAQAGAEIVVLETGTEQPDAIALYQRAGYSPTVRFGHYAWSETARYFAKRFSPEAVDPTPGG